MNNSDVKIVCMHDNPPSKLMRCVAYILANILASFKWSYAQFRKNEHAKPSLHDSDIIEHEERDQKQPIYNTSRLES